MSELEHSLIGASSMHRWANCPGSVNLSRGMPNITSSYAAEGSKAHEIAAYYLLHDRWPDDFYVDQNQEMADAISVYTNAVFEDKRAFNHTFNGNLFLIEHGFQLKSIDHNAFGTSDCVLYNAQSKTLIVYDYKHGAGISVDVDHNEQLMYYALGALLSIPKLQVAKVVLKIVQPRCPHPEGVVREYKFDSHELLDFYSFLEKAIRATQSSDAPLKEGEWCRFCPAAPKCPLLNKKALDFAKDIFKPETFGPEQISEMLDKAEVIEGFISQVREYAYQEAMHGRLPPGYKLVQKRATRKWKHDEETTKVYLKEKLDIPSMDLYETPKLRSPTQIEKLLSKDLKTKLTELVSSESSGLKLAKLSETGDPVLLDAKSIFGEA